MNKRQKKKQFKKIHGMKPTQHFLEKEIPEIVKVVADEVIRAFYKLNGTCWEIARVRMAHANLLRNLTKQRKQGRRKKGRWS